MNGKMMQFITKRSCDALQKQGERRCQMLSLSSSFIRPFPLPAQMGYQAHAVL